MPTRCWPCGARNIMVPSTESLIATDEGSKSRQGRNPLKNEECTQCHTIKNLLVIDERCHICFLSATYEGKANDKSLAELEGYTLPHGSCLYQDMGFQGFILNGITIVQPKKKPPGGNLTPPEKATNRAISSIRV